MVTVVCILISCQVETTPQDPFPAVVRAMMIVESGCNPEAYRADEDALGALQVRPGYLSDVNKFRARRGLKPYSRRDCKDPIKAIDMVREYTSTYARVKSRPWTAETISKIHNGGPMGWKKSSTTVYWNKIKGAMR